MCNTAEESISPEKSINHYFAALNKSDFNEIKNYLVDSFVLAEKEFIICKSLNEYKHLFQWDSVFEPDYHLIELKSGGNNYEAIISKKCKRISFLHDSAIIYKSHIELKNNKISKICTIENLTFDTLK